MHGEWAAGLVESCSNLGTRYYNEGLNRGQGSEGGGVYWSVRAAATKSHRLPSLKNRRLVSPSSGERKAQGHGPSRFGNNYSHFVICQKIR